MDHYYYISYRTLHESFRPRMLHLPSSRTVNLRLDLLSKTNRYYAYSNTAIISTHSIISTQLDSKSARTSTEMSTMARSNLYLYLYLYLYPTTATARREYYIISNIATAIRSKLTEMMRIFIETTATRGVNRLECENQQKDICLVAKSISIFF